MTGLSHYLYLLFLIKDPSCRPILLILDGHSSRINYNLRKLARDNEIHLLKLPAHCTHLLQPLDVAVLKPLKTAWYNVVQNFIRRERRVVTKRDFPSMLAEAWQIGYKKENGISGFKKAGIIPMLCHPKHWHLHRHFVMTLTPFLYS